MHLAAADVHYLTKESLGAFTLALSPLFDACVTHRTPLMSHGPNAEHGQSKITPSYTEVSRRKTL